MNSRKNELKEAIFRERKPYTQSEIKLKFQTRGELPNENDIVALIKRLKEYGALKVCKVNAIKKSIANLAESDEILIYPVLPNDDKTLYAFTFVGILYVAVNGCEYVIKSLPKYIHDENCVDKKLKTVISVLEKYKVDETLNLFGDSRIKSSTARFAVMLKLLRDYAEYGLYYNERRILENNGSGEINWERTINSNLPYINNKNIIYAQLKTRKTVDEERNYFKRLHKYALTLCTRELKKLNMFTLFEDLCEADLSDETLEDFGSVDYIDYRILNELTVQYNTRKQFILRLLRAFIRPQETYLTDDEFKMFGTTSFHEVWERVCKDILNDKLDKRYAEFGGKKLSDLIQKPVWKIKNDKDYAVSTLIPDLVTITGNKFYIIDAKYYDISFNPFSGQPGLESITKQYLYESAYRIAEKADGTIFDLIGAREVYNCFLFPVDDDNVNDFFNNKGSVSFGVLNNCTINEQNLNDIQILIVSAQKMFDYYLSGKKLKVCDLSKV